MIIKSQHLGVTFSRLTVHIGWPGDTDLAVQGINS